MSNSLTFYSPQPESFLQALLEETSDWLDHTTDGLMGRLWESRLEGLALVEIHPPIEGMTLEDFDFDRSQVDIYGPLFQDSQACVSFVELDDLYLNPLQVDYLKYFLSRCEEGLVDLGGLEPLRLKTQFLKELESYPGLISSPPVKKVKPVSTKTDPMSAILQEIVERKSSASGVSAWSSVRTEFHDREGLMKIMDLIEAGESAVYQKSGLNIKTFGDNLERLRLLMKHRTES